MDYTSLIKEFGTPCYVYNIDTLLERIHYLKDKLSSKYDLVYAVKANTFIADSIKETVSRYEICSPGEFEICHNLEINHNKMVISGVYKDLETIEMMIKNYDDILKYTVESLSQYELLNLLTKKYNRKINVLLRLNSGNQFGMSQEDIRHLLKKHTNTLITIDGIEYFSGTQKHSIKRLDKEISQILEFINNIENEFNINIEEIEYGPGLPVFYYQDDEFNEDEFLNDLKEILDKVPKKVTLEIGRSIAASCGTYLTKVVDMKSNKYGNYVIVDGGINHLVYYGQTMAMKIPNYDLLPHKNIKETNIYNICGSLCTINDFLVKNITTRKLEKGDVFAFKNVGAYSSTEGISLFLSRDLPKIILYSNGKYNLVRNNIKTYELNFPKI